ncbi:putative reverse transcriptase domain-containing protein [Tanacetum coccineum]
MPPKSAPLTQAAIRRMIKESVDAATAVFAGLIRRRELRLGYIQLLRLALARTELLNYEEFDERECFLESNECSRGKEDLNQMPWTEMKQLMTSEFCLIEELQRMEHELWNLKVKEYNIVAYTQRFNELALMCLRMVEPERVKVDAYIRGLTGNIKGEVEGDGEVRVMTRGFGDLVAKLGDKVVMEVLVRCWNDGDVVVRSW